MKHLAAYMLLILSGKEKPTEEEIIKFMDEIDIPVDDERLKNMLAKMGEIKPIEHLTNKPEVEIV